MGQLWNMHRMYREQTWNMYGIGMEYVWNMNGICMTYVRNMYGILIEYVTDGACRPGSSPSRTIMDTPRCVVCVSFVRPNMVVTEYAWNMHGIRMECV